MPTYDYVCAACAHAFEYFQSLSDKLLRNCPACGKRKLERQFGTGIGVVFKGSGFYETDYKRAGQPGPKTEATSDSSGSKDGKDSKSKPNSEGAPSGGEGKSGSASDAKGDKADKSAPPPKSKGDGKRGSRS